MKRIHPCRILSFILCIVLIAAPALTCIGCHDTPHPPDADTTVGGTETTAPTVKGEGETMFYFRVVDSAGRESLFEIHTDKTTVGEALLSLGLIAGDNDAYGLYVKTVLGETVDYNTDKAYWAFYEGDSYASTGVDSTTITPGATYAFVVEKG